MDSGMNEAQASCATRDVFLCPFGSMTMSEREQLFTCPNGGGQAPSLLSLSIFVCTMWLFLNVRW